jgi:hypothetical protein
MPSLFFFATPFYIFAIIAAITPAHRIFFFEPLMPLLR